MQEGVYTVLPTCVSTSWYVQFVLHTVGRLFSRESAVKRPVHQVFVGVQPKTPERRSVRISDDEARRSWSRWWRPRRLPASSWHSVPRVRKRAYSASGAASCGCWPATVYVGSSDELVRRSGCGGSCRHTPRGRCPTLGQLRWFRSAFCYFVSAGGVRLAGLPTSTRRSRWFRR